VADECIPTVSRQMVAEFLAEQRHRGNEAPWIEEVQNLLDAHRVQAGRIEVLRQKTRELHERIGQLNGENDRLTDPLQAVRGRGGAMLFEVTNSWDPDDSSIARARIEMVQRVDETLFDQLAERTAPKVARLLRSTCDARHLPGPEQPVEHCTLPAGHAEPHEWRGVKS
jgi:hypothetical protein